VDHIGIAAIAEQTTADKTLKKPHENGKTWIPKEDEQLSKYTKILPELQLQAIEFFSKATESSFQSLSTKMPLI